MIGGIVERGPTISLFMRFYYRSLKLLLQTPPPFAKDCLKKAGVDVTLPDARSHKDIRGYYRLWIVDSYVQDCCLDDILRNLGTTFSSEPHIAQTVRHNRVPEPFFTASIAC
jgi:hypothetical protein